VTGLRPLRPCGSGSCVSSQAPRTRPLRRIEPLQFVGPRADAIHALLTVLARTPRVRILERDDVIVHAVARTAVLRLPIDIEVVVDERRGRIDLRVSTMLALRERSGSRAYATGLLRSLEAELRAGR